LIEAGIVDDLYLAGGVAIAIHLGHRQSVDLDFFSCRPDFDVERLRDRLRVLHASAIGVTDVTLSVRLGSVPVDFVRYPYKVLARFLRGPEGVRLASLRDLAVMKLAAIARRGIRRDFWDLFEILDRASIRLASALDDYRRKFGVSEADIYHVIRALTWFDEAERDRVFPKGLTRPRWRKIRAWFEQAAAAELARRTQ
jgi:Nucleotidyl transferase AbiEii toxin, Type IV TA system